VASESECDCWMPTIVVHISFGVEPASPLSHKGKGDQETNSVEKQQSAELLGTTGQFESSGPDAPISGRRRSQIESRASEAICHRTDADGVESTIPRSHACGGALMGFSWSDGPEAGG
jgi:hypothetical protein